MLVCYRVNRLGYGMTNDRKAERGYGPNAKAYDRNDEKLKSHVIFRLGLQVATKQLNSKFCQQCYSKTLITHGELVRKVHRAIT